MSVSPSRLADCPAPPDLPGLARRPFLLIAMSLSRLLHLLSLTLAAVTAALVVRAGVQEWGRWQQAVRGSQAIALLQADLLVAERLSFERGPANALMGARQEPPDPERLRTLQQARARTDAALARLAELLKTQRQPQIPGAESQLQNIAARLSEARSRVDATIAQPPAQRAAAQIQASVQAMIAIVPLLTPLTNALEQAARQTQPATESHLQTLRLTSDLREQAGLLGSHFTASLTSGQPFAPNERLAIERTRGHIGTLQWLIEQRLSAPDTPPVMAERWAAVQRGYFDEAQRQLVAPVIAAGNPEGHERFQWTAAQFADRYVPRLQLIVALRDAVLVHLQEQAAAVQRAALHSLALVMAVSLALVLLTGYLLLTLRRRVLRPLAQVTRALQALTRNELEAPLPQITVEDEGAAVVRAVRALQQQIRARQMLEVERDSLIAQLREQSLTDELTGLPNRRAFFAGAAQRLSLALRQRFEVAVVMLDVDSFKAFNDRAGHTTGDAALRIVAAAMRSALRSEDSAARYGGEEFVVLLAPCSLAQARLLAERVREAVAATPVPLPDGSAAQLTVSLGVAVSSISGFDLEQLLSDADDALYRAKRGGRNRVELAEEPAAEAGAAATIG